MPREIERVGKVRPSQLLWTYGPGATIDLPNFSVMTLGIDAWKNCTPIGEARLLGQVRRILGAQVNSLRQPPVCEEEHEDLRDPISWQGVPVQPFPRWFRCVKCGLMAPYDSGLFEFKGNTFRPEKARFVHVGCPKGGGHPVDAVPVRFMVACRNGHLDEFPWSWFVHGGPSTCTGPLYFFERGASVQTENLWVKCDKCGVKRSMATAYATPGQRSPLPCCRGHHPHLGYGDSAFEPCDEPIRPILLGATNSWFPRTVSVLAIPTQDTILAQLVADNWGDVFNIEDEKELSYVVKTWKREETHPDLRQFDVSEIWAAIQAEKKRLSADEGGNSNVTEEDIKVPEWLELTSGNPHGKYPEFVCRSVPPPPSFQTVIQKVLCLDRLRKVNALVGFTRLESLDSFMEGNVRVAPLCAGKPTWIPSCEVFGEGIFLQFKESTIAQWEEKPAVKARETKLRQVYAGWRDNHHLDSNIGFPGVRYYLLHTLSHLVIRELALECGYNAASIQERVYAQGGNSPMAGILIYTAASDSDGTLGGLVSLGEPGMLNRILRKALERAKTCSSDPLCSDQTQTADWLLHGAACHACSFVAETSCESANRYLDRALVVPTYSIKDAAFFPV